MSANWGLVKAGTSGLAAFGAGAFGVGFLSRSAIVIGFSSGGVLRRWWLKRRFLVAVRLFHGQRTKRVALWIVNVAELFLVVFRFGLFVE